jgi:L-threonylcarbamoyladenylate synthase
MNLTSTADAIKMIKNGKVGVLPTDTLYGLVARAADPAAVKKLYALKHREHKPGTMVAANIEQLIELGLNEKDLKAAAYLWPNPIGVVMHMTDLGYLHQGLNEFSVRITANEEVRNLLLQTGPLMTSSANTTGDPSSTNIEMAHDYFADAVDFYVDGGDLSGRAPSTIVDIKNGELVVYREGAISKKQLDLLAVQNR